MRQLLFIIIISVATSNLHAQTFEQWYNNLSDKEKIAQVFVTGIRSKGLSYGEKKLLKSWPVGGLIFFKRNYKSTQQFVDLNKSINKIFKSDLSPFTFTDQEGGDVVRIGSLYDSPTPLSVGQLNSEKVTSYLGRAYGSLLSELNISSNLAPVVDVLEKDSLNFISTRSFGSDPDLVSKMSLSLSKGMIKSGVIPTLKHFPGLGGIKSDNHDTASVKKSTYENLISRDWLPYKIHAESKIPFFVMTSHTRLVMDDKDLGLVTYSKEALDILRQVTGSNQVAITDDLEMKGAQTKMSFEESALKSFLAGHDLILIGWSGTKLISTLIYFQKQVGKAEFDLRLKESLQRLYSLRNQKKQVTKLASAFTKSGALNLTSGLNSKISEYLVNKTSKDIETRSPATKDSFFYFSSDMVFRRNLKGKNNASLLQTPVEKIRDLCSSKMCVLHITGEKTAARVNNILSKQNLENYIVLNSADPELLDSRYQKNMEIINTYTRSYRLSNQVQSLLENKSSHKHLKAPKKVASF